MTDYQWNPVGEFAAGLSGVIHSKRAVFDQYIEQHPDQWVWGAIGNTAVSLGEGTLEPYQIGSGLVQASQDGSWVTGSVQDTMRAIGLIPVAGALSKQLTPGAVALVEREATLVAPALEELPETIATRMDVYVRDIQSQMQNLTVPITAADGTVAQVPVESGCVLFSTALIARAQGLDVVASASDLVKALSAEDLAGLTTLKGIPIEPAVAILTDLGADVTTMAVGAVRTEAELVTALQDAGPGAMAMLGVDTGVAPAITLCNVLKNVAATHADTFAADAGALNGLIDSFTNLEQVIVQNSGQTLADLMPEVQAVARQWSAGVPVVADAMDQAVAALGDVNTKHLVTALLDETGQLLTRDAAGDYGLAGGLATIAGEQIESALTGTVAIVKNVAFLGEEALANVPATVAALESSDLSGALVGLMQQLLPALATIGIPVAPILRGDVDQTMHDLSAMAIDPSTGVSVFDQILAGGQLPTTDGAPQTTDTGPGAPPVAPITTSPPGAPGTGATPAVPGDSGLGAMLAASDAAAAATAEPTAAPHYLQGSATYDVGRPPSPGSAGQISDAPGDASAPRSSGGEPRGGSGGGSSGGRPAASGVAEDAAGDDRVADGQGGVPSPDDVPQSLATIHGTIDDAADPQSLQQIHGLLGDTSSASPTEADATGGVDSKAASADPVAPGGATDPANTSGATTDSVVVTDPAAPTGSVTPTDAATPLDGTATTDHTTSSGDTTPLDGAATMDGAGTTGGDACGIAADDETRTELSTTAATVPAVTGSDAGDPAELTTTAVILGGRNTTAETTATDPLPVTPGPVDWLVPGSDASSLFGDGADPSSQTSTLGLAIPSADAAFATTTPPAVDGSAATSPDSSPEQGTAGPVNDGPDAELTTSATILDPSATGREATNPDPNNVTATAAAATDAVGGSGAAQVPSTLPVDVAATVSPDDPTATPGLSSWLVPGQETSSLFAEGTPPSTPTDAPITSDAVAPVATTPTDLPATATVAPNDTPSDTTTPAPIAADLPTPSTLGSTSADSGPPDSAPADSPPPDAAPTDSAANNPALADPTSTNAADAELSTIAVILPKGGSTDSSAEAALGNGADTTSPRTVPTGSGVATDPTASSTAATATAGGGAAASGDPAAAAAGDTSSTAVADPTAATPGTIDWLVSGQQDSALFADQTAAADQTVMADQTMAADQNASDSKSTTDGAVNAVNAPAAVADDNTTPNSTDGAASSLPTSASGDNEPNPASGGSEAPAASHIDDESGAATPASTGEPAIGPDPELSTSAVILPSAPAADHAESVTTTDGGAAAVTTPGLTDWLMPGAEGSSLFGDTNSGSETGPGWDSGLVVEPSHVGGAADASSPSTADTPAAETPASGATTSGTSDDQASGGGDANAADPQQISVSPVTGQPYATDAVTGTSSAIAASGVDNAGNPIYQAPEPAGGATFEIAADASVTAVTDVGPIDTSTWGTPPQDDTGAWTSGPTPGEGWTAQTDGQSQPADGGGAPSDGSTGGATDGTDGTSDGTATDGTTSVDGTDGTTDGTGSVTDSGGGTDYQDETPSYAEAPSYATGEGESEGAVTESAPEAPAADPPS